GGALALAVADRVYAWSGAMYSVISPEGCAAILWKNQSAALEAAAALRIGARDLLDLGVLDAVLPEPPGGTGRDPAASAAALRAAVATALAELAELPAADLVARRRDRFARHGRR
ncbi:acetyl-CoA carboxylase carboxyl transferase subunit beta, partial [Spirillospora sp. NPDC049652]